MRREEEKENKTDILSRVLKAQKDMEAADRLIQDYLPYIKKETAKVTGKVPEEGFDDELSIAMIGFHEAVRRYQPAKGTFLQYASVIMRNRLIDYHRKEMRHKGQLSIQETLGEEGYTLEETLCDEKAEFENFHEKNATMEEILELTAQLREFGLSLSDIAENCPKQRRTLESCKKAIQYGKENPQLIQNLLHTRKLPILQISKGTGVEKKTLERHRKYIMALLLIYSNGYEIIRGHLKQIFHFQEGGAAV